MTIYVIAINIFDTCTTILLNTFLWLILKDNIHYNIILNKILIIFFLINTWL